MAVDKSNIGLAGVIGDPISHSISPIIQNYWIKENNINGYYIPIRISCDQIEKKIQ